MKRSLQCLLTATIVPTAFAQVLVFEHQIPEDLTVDVDSNTPDFWISFDGDAKEDGFISSLGRDAEDVASAPDFYISDIPTTGDTINLLVGMIRTTSNESRSLHWLVSETRITSQDAQEAELSSRETLLQYQAPGTTGERGIQYYTFALWTAAGPDINIDGLPEDDVLKDFNVERFEEENNLEGPIAVADIGIEVKEDGEQEVDEVADNESSSEDEDIDEIIDIDDSSDIDVTDAALAFDMASRLALAIICSSILGLLLT